MGEEAVVPVAIVGAGLAGLALAVGLHERKVPFLVFERSPILRQHSLATIFGLTENGSTALEGIRPGLSSLMRSYGIPIESINNIYFEEPGKPITTEKRRPNTILIPWASAQRLLASLIPSENIVYNHKLITYEAVEGGAKAVFEVISNEGSSVISKTVHTKLLIGADGLRSSARKILLGDPPRDLHQVFWNAVTSNLDDMVEKHRTGQIVGIRNEAKTASSFMLRSGDGCGFWNIVTLDADGELSKIIDANKGSTDSFCRKACALKAANLFGDWDIMRKFIEDTPPENIAERHLMDHVPAVSWSGAAGHVLLIGDAAHAMHFAAGQGAMTSYEDAHQLSNLLDTAFGSSDSLTIADAVQRFEKIRIPRVTRIQNYSAEFSGYMRLKPNAMPLLPEKEREKRQEEFRNWLGAYPEKLDGDPDSEYWR